jgi:DNA-binding transcriptional regulator YdaS (Cro superfamily)
MDDRNKALKRAIEIAGGQNALAEALGVYQSNIHYWLCLSKNGVKAEYVAKIERLTGVPRHQLRPDLWEK